MNIEDYLSDYVSPDVAKLLKEKGYDKPCRHYYANGEFTDSCSAMNHNYSDREVSVCSAPSLCNVAKWLREEHNIHICIYTSAGGYDWRLDKANRDKDCTCGTYIDDSIKYYNEANPKTNDSGSFDGYEDCVNDAIFSALKFI